VVDNRYFVCESTLKDADANVPVYVVFVCDKFRVSELSSPYTEIVPVVFVAGKALEMVGVVESPLLLVSGVGDHELVALIASMPTKRMAEL
jgi:hypothetical protein